MAWMIVCDSSCEIRELEHPSAGVQFALVPFKIRVGEREYVDLATLNVYEVPAGMRKGLLNLSVSHSLDSSPVRGAFGK